MNAVDTPKDRRKARRVARAEATRRRALSPLRIGLRLATIPVLTLTITMSLFIRTSDYPPEDALRHLVALAGCSAASSVDLAPARLGDLGYHARNDPDGDGIACGTALATQTAVSTPVSEVVAAPSERMQGGARFLRP